MGQRTSNLESYKPVISDDLQPRDSTSDSIPNPRWGSPWKFGGSSKVSPEPSGKPSRKFNSQCTARTWLEILSSSESAEDGSIVTHGMTLFQESFFRQLKTFDTEGKVFELLDGCQYKSKSGNKSASHVLMIIVRFIATVKCNSRQMSKRLAELGRCHQRLNITRSHMILFVDALLLTVSDRLGSRSTPSVLSAWKDVSMFCVDSMYKTTYLFFSVHSSSSLLELTSDRSTRNFEENEAIVNFSNRDMNKETQETVGGLILERLNSNPKTAEHGVTNCVQCTNLSCVGDGAEPF